MCFSLKCYLKSGIVLRLFSDVLLSRSVFYGQICSHFLATRVACPPLLFLTPQLTHDTHPLPQYSNQPD